MNDFLDHLDPRKQKAEKKAVDETAARIERIKELQSQLIEIESSRDQLADDMQWVLTSLTLAVDAFGPLVGAYTTAKNAHHRGANPCEYLEPNDFERARAVYRSLAAMEQGLKDRGYEWEFIDNWDLAYATLAAAEHPYAGGPPGDEHEVHGPYTEEKDE